MLGHAATLSVRTVTRNLENLRNLDQNDREPDPSHGPSVEEGSRRAEPNAARLTRGANACD
jgi:hypothetical protein